MTKLESKNIQDPKPLFEPEIWYRENNRGIWVEMTYQEYIERWQQEQKITKNNNE
ncbi:MAG: hypothetical protein RLY40_5 [Pseudomonadota bacterium]|jgi:hypothetical protein